MRFTRLLCFLLILTNSTFSQNYNFTLLGRLEYDKVLSNVWGYTSPSGKEYALVGTESGLSVVDVSNPSTPTEIAHFNGPTSIWREVRTYKNFAYFVTEGSSGNGNGLSILDMTDVDNGNITFNVLQNIGQAPPPNGSGMLGNIHTLHIDEEKGFCYLYGATSFDGIGGAVVLNLEPNPNQPQFAGIYNATYIHDGIVRNDTMWSCEIFDGRFAVVDFTDKLNPTILATQQTPGNFTHNSWLDDSGKYLFTTDEVSSAFVTAYDVSDLSNIKEVDRFRTARGNTIIPHNTYYINGFLPTSYYTDGVLILDARVPENLVEIARYDTYPQGQGSGFDGCWGVYPYFPSGIIVASDIQNGLFVLQPEYKKAARFSGRVRNGINGNPIPLANVLIVQDQSNQTKRTDIGGFYKTGTPKSGNIEIQFSAAGYVTRILNLNVEEGENYTLDVDLFPIGSSISENSVEILGVKLIENPVTNQANLWVEDIGKSGEVVGIKDLNGKTIRNFEINLGMNYLDISNLKSGIYFFHFPTLQLNLKVVKL